MQGKAVFFGSRMDKFNMLVAFIIALILCVSTIQAAPTDTNLIPEGKNCCPMKFCYKIEFRSEENNKMDFMVTHTTCGCDSASGQVCMNSFDDIEQSLRFLAARSKHYGV